MKIIVLDGYVLNTGDLSWDGLKKPGDFTIYDRTPAVLTVERAKAAYSTASVAQMVFSHILNFAQNVSVHAASVSSGE